jgi:hypothetical protein
MENTIEKLDVLRRYLALSEEEGKNIEQSESDSELFQDRETLEDDLKGYFDYESQYWIFPVDAYIHSLVRISLANTKDYPDRRWDVSTSGYILVEKETWNNFDDAVKAAEGLIKEWNYYLSGEVYGFIIEKPKTIYSISKEKFDKLKFENDLATLEDEFSINTEWEEIDSCGGNYSTVDELIEECKEIIDNYEH